MAHLVLQLPGSLGRCSASTSEIEKTLLRMELVEPSCGEVTDQAMRRGCPHSTRSRVVRARLLAAFIAHCCHLRKQIEPITRSVYALAAALAACRRDAVKVNATLEVLRQFSLKFRQVRGSGRSR